MYEHRDIYLQSGDHKFLYVLPSVYVQEFKFEKQWKNIVRMLRTEARAREALDK